MSTTPHLPADSPVGPPASILLVDDRAENLQALEAVLEPLGRRVVTAESGHEALRILLAEQFAVILLDVQMPEMDGFETATYIRQRAKTRTIPIIFLTAISTNPEHVFRGYEAGAVDYLIKPIEPAILRSKVAVFVELYEKTQVLAQNAILLREHELERARHEAAARQQRRDRFLATAATALEKRLDVQGRLDELAAVCVPELADFVLVGLRGEEGAMQLAAFAHGDREREDALRDLLASRPARDILDSSLSQPPEARLLAETNGAAWSDFGMSRETAHVLDLLEPRSLITAPVVLRGEPLAQLVVGMSSSDRRFGTEELDVVRDLAGRAAMALENSQLYEAERELSRTLQLSLLGECTLENRGVTAAMRYVPGTAGLEVGGDWYDVLEREDGRILAVVGDVVGHGISAATTMGKLRSAVGALGTVIESTPTLLNRLDQFASRIDEAHFGTVAAVILEPETGVIRYSLAGHPPPLVVTPEGDAEYLDGGRGLPLGVDWTTGGRIESRAQLVPGATLILFTDGLVERRDSSLDDGLQRLLAAASAHRDCEPEALCDALIEELVDAPRDDVVVVCLRLEPTQVDCFGRRFPAAPEAVPLVRHALKDWLEEHGLPQNDVFDVVLACGEASANAVEHPYADQGGEAVLEVRLHEDELIARVRDFGRWREGSRSHERGRGTQIMRAVMDDVHFHVTRHGTTVVMRRRVQTAASAAGSRATVKRGRARSRSVAGD